MLDVNQRAVLVIDRLGDPQLAESLHESRTGYRTVICEDLESGLQELDRQERAAALILLLLGKPASECGPLLEEIRQQPASRWVPAVVLAPDVDGEVVGRCDRAGVNSYVRFDVEKARGSGLVNSVLKYWLQLNLLPDPRGREAAGHSL